MYQIFPIICTLKKKVGEQCGNTTGEGKVHRRFLPQPKQSDIALQNVRKRLFCFLYPILLHGFMPNHGAV